MAWEFASKRYFPKADIDTLYILDFDDIIINKFGSAYNLFSNPRITDNEKAVRIQEGKEGFMREMEAFLKGTQETEINPKIRKLIEACYNKGISFEWTDRKQSEKFLMQVRSAKSIGYNIIVKKLEAKKEPVEIT